MAVAPRLVGPETKSDLFSQHATYLYTMSEANRHRAMALLLSVALHVAVLYGAGLLTLRARPVPDPQPDPEHIVMIHLAVPQEPQEVQPPLPRPTPEWSAAPPETRSDIQITQPDPALPPEPQRPRARMDAPPAPTAEEWAQASTYTLKNSKRYRYTWGQQVRSMMGTAVEGPDQGVVRFRIEIAPDGSLTSLETLWSTSAMAEHLARQAIQNMPPLPPSPTGKPLVFEKTISFQPDAQDAPPVYRDDCLPDPPAYRNPFAWDGKSPQERQVPTAARPVDPEELAECLRQLPKDSVEAEAAHTRRQLERWGSDSLWQTESPSAPR